MKSRPAIVAVGGSLGGIDAVSELLLALPSSFDIPMAIVLHRAAVSPGSLARVVSRLSDRLVVEAEDGMSLAPCGVYLAPPDYHLLVEGNMLRLSIDGPVLHARPSIDVLFESASDSHRERARGVLLTGASDDGAAGIRRLVLAGGRACVQCPRDARSPIAPRAAIKALGAQANKLDVVGSLPQIAECIQDWARASVADDVKRSL